MLSWHIHQLIKGLCMWLHNRWELMWITTKYAIDTTKRVTWLPQFCALLPDANVFGQNSQKFLCDRWEFINNKVMPWVPKMLQFGFLFITQSPFWIHWKRCYHVCCLPIDQWFCDSSVCCFYWHIFLSEGFHNCLNKLGLATTTFSIKDHPKRRWIFTSKSLLQMPQDNIVCTKLMLFQAWEICDWRNDASGGSMHTCGAMAELSGLFNQLTLPLVSVSLMLCSGSIFVFCTKTSDFIWAFQVIGFKRSSPVAFPTELCLLRDYWRVSLVALFTISTARWPCVSS